MADEQQQEPTPEEVAEQIQRQLGMYVGQVFFDPRQGVSSVMLDKETVDALTSRFPLTIGSLYVIIGRDATAAGAAHLVHEKSKGKQQQGPQIVTASSLPASVPPPPRGNRGKGRR